MSVLEPESILAAAERLDGIVNRTPVMQSRTLNEIGGCQIFLKCENFQRIGAFKFRGAYNAISQLSDEQKRAGVVTHSSGNHAQGVALAAKLLGVKATIVMPADSTPVKMEATAGYGARVVTCDAAEREAISGRLMDEHGYTLIHPYDNDHVIQGQGTAALELIDEVGDLDLILTPCGGGGLLSGTALAAALKLPNCRVVGVEPQSGDDAGQSWKSGQIVTLDNVPDTIADGVRTRFIGERNHAVMQKYVADMTTVTEYDIMETLMFVWSRMKIVIEPSSAVALAPLFKRSYPADGLRVGVIITGGNVNVPGCGFFLQGA